MNMKTVERGLVGIDEAGRGPLAGPLTVGVFAVSDREVLRSFRGAKESKQLSHEQREEWFAKICDLAAKGDIFYSVSFGSHTDIDELGLTQTVSDCISVSLSELLRQCAITYTTEIRLDGLLKAPPQFTHQKTLVHGDAREKIIALASICAKVLRDRHMIKIARSYPNYLFDKHKGYGTKEHYEALHKYGLTPIHRRRFLRNFISQ